MSLQHFVHLFIGREMKDFRDLFSDTFHRLNPEIPDAFFTPLLLETDKQGISGFSALPSSDSLDSMELNQTDRETSIINFFDDIYSRKVSVGNPGNKSMVIAIWCRLFDNKPEDCNLTIEEILGELLRTLGKCRSNISIEVNGFTNDAVSFFIPEVARRLSPDIYRTNFNKNEAFLAQNRGNLQAIRLISNFNIDDVALNLNLEEIARVCSEFAAIQCLHYLDLYRPLASSAPNFESFGLSSIVFDLQYYRDYISNRIIIDKISEENIGSRRFNLNLLAGKSNPLLKEIIGEIKSFYEKYGTDAKAKLALGKGVNDSEAVAAVDKELNNIIENLRNKISGLLESDNLSLFEREALMNLILGDDCEMFEVSNVNADEVIIDDIIDEATQYYTSLDPEGDTLQRVTQQQIKSIRTQMRNIASVNREREKRLEALDRNRKQVRDQRNHFDGNGYRFGDTDYKVDLQVDTIPLTDTYVPSMVNVANIDLRNRFMSVRNQGSQGCCSAFAVAAVIEAMRNDKRRYSPAFLYWNARVLADNTQVDSGSSINQVIIGGVEKGDCYENSMEYNADLYNVPPTEDAFKEAENCKILKALNVNLNLDDIKSALAEGFPVIIAAKIFDSFANTKGGFVPRPSRSEINSEGRTDGHGNHAMVICGFSDKEKVFVVRNSWGREFGDDGYCYISYSYAKKYFLQAAIITEVTPTEEERRPEATTTLNFNESDSTIQAAILQNLIDDDKDTLEELAAASTRLKTKWTENVERLGNVNIQHQLVKGEQNRLESQIFDEDATINSLTSEVPGKVKAFKVRWWKVLAYLVVASLLATWAVIEIPDSMWVWTGFALIVGSTLIAFGRYVFSWKSYRQSLLDEIQAHSDHKDKINSIKVSLALQGHIRGKMLRDVGNYRLDLQNKKNALHSFNQAVIDLYERKEKELARMSPEVPYPFLTVLDNRKLDKFYETNREKLTSIINFRNLAERYNVDDSLFDLFVATPEFVKIIEDVIKDFSMRDYLIEQGSATRWTFLPAIDSLSDVIKELEQHALPFCRYNAHIDNHDIEKYIFAKDLRESDISRISRYFERHPMPIATHDRFTVSILNIVRY